VCDVPGGLADISVGTIDALPPGWSVAGARTARGLQVFNAASIGEGDIPRSRSWCPVL